MNNKIKLIILAVLSATALVFVAKNLDNKENITAPEVKIIEPMTTEYEVDKTLILQEKLSALELVGDKKEKLLLFKEIIDEYPEICDGFKGLYDVHTKEEINLLHRVVQAEIGNGDFDAKVNVANTILNRYYGGFGYSLIEVLNPNQFATVRNGSIDKVTVSEDTILACEYTYLFEDTTDGALYFESMNSSVHQDYAEFIFDDGYHKFYK